MIHNEKWLIGAFIIKPQPIWNVNRFFEEFRLTRGELFFSPVFSCILLFSRIRFQNFYLQFSYVSAIKTV